jgi:type IV pilus assembly protein PilM
MLSREQKRLVGLDIGSTSVKLVELSGGSPPFDLQTIALVSVNDSETEDSYERAVSLILETNTISTPRVATSVSGQHVAVRDLRFPKLAPNEIRGAVWYEGGQVIAFDINDAYVDYTVTCTTEGEEEGTNVLFAAASRPEVDFKSRIIERSGLKPRIIGVDMLVLLDALLMRGDLPETIALLHVGARGTGVGVARGNTTPFVRDLDIGGDSYTKTIAETLGISTSEAETAKIAEAGRDQEIQGIIASVTSHLVGELTRSIVYYQTRGHGSKIQKLFLCGGSSRMPGLSEAISNALEIPVEHWSPIDDVRVDSARFDLPSVEQLSPFVALATALAMQEDAH